jgi:hypothetical protein
VAWTARDVSFWKSGRQPIPLAAAHDAKFSSDRHLDRPKPPWSRNCSINVIMRTADKTIPMAHNLRLCERTARWPPNVGFREQDRTSKSKALCPVLNHAGEVSRRGEERERKIELRTSDAGRMLAGG